MKNFLSYAVEAYHHSKGSVLSLIAGLGFIWGIFNNLLSKEIALYTLAILSGLVLVYALIKYFSWLRHVIKGRMMVPIFGERKITLLRNDYQKNMDYLLHHLPQHDLDNFTFVMGIDRTGNLSISSKGGVVYSVLSYLNENYNCCQELPIDYIQKELNNYINTHSHADELNKLPYGACINVKLKLQPKDEMRLADEIQCNLILIANSRKEVPNEKDMEENMMDDDKSNIIVPKVFDYLQKTKKFTGAMIGVMGTNGMRQSYQVVFSQIINQYARICHKDNLCPLNHLYISIRDKDYIHSHITLSHLEKYVRHCAEYYSTRNQTNEV